MTGLELAKQNQPVDEQSKQAALPIVKSPQT